MTSQIEPFGATEEGEAVMRVRLSGGGLTASIITYGATVQDLRLDGHAPPLVLGAPMLAPYLGPMAHFGALCGRFANRIGGARFTLDGVEHRLEANALGRHTLHGGTRGLGRRVWEIAEVSAASATLSIVSPAGEAGFPGTLTVTACFSLTDDASLAIEIEAETDAPTPCSIAHHGYFNLDGGADVIGHTLRIAADHVLALDRDTVPTGALLAVDGTRYDFRAPRAIGAEPYDVNFCLSNVPRRPCTPVACLAGGKGALAMTLRTTAPGLQLFNAPRLSLPVAVGLDGRRYGPFAGLALETQCWPDAPNHPGFPDSILRPGERYRHAVSYGFERL